jgi:hypothetical protein
MLNLTILGLMALLTPAAPPRHEVVFNGTEFGEPQTLRCIWFTNLENSRLEQRRGQAGSTFPTGENASIECAKDVCAQLDLTAKRASRQAGGEAPSGEFVVRFVGRVSAGKHEPHFLGDGTRTVLIEKFLALSNRKSGK